MSTTSSGSITTSTVNGTTRMTGLSSGLDVDGIVEKLVTAEKAKKLNKLQQEEQKAEWTQAAYQSVILDVTEFSDTYLSTDGSKSILRASNFLQYDAESSSSAVSVTASKTASAGSHTVSVTQLATKATATSDESVTKDVQGSEDFDYTKIDSSDTFTITLDGEDYTVSLSTVAAATSETAVLTALETAINAAVGTSVDEDGNTINKITVSKNSDSCLEIVAEDEGVQQITVNATSNSGLENLGFGDGAILTNRLSTSSTLSEIASELNTTLTFDTNGRVAMSINGTTMYFDKSITLADMISEINDADLGVTASYNSVTGKMTLTADDTGAGDSITVSDITDSSAASNSNFASIFFGAVNEGTDAKFTIDGQAFARSTNSLTIDGITYALNQVTTTTTETNGTKTVTDNPLTVTVTQDTDGVYDLLSNFIDAYNELIESLNSTIDENYDTDYAPLTDDQKEEMSDDEISDWEAKAKVGLLESDSIIEDMLSDIRDSMMIQFLGLVLVVFLMTLQVFRQVLSGKMTASWRLMKISLSLISRVTPKQL